MKKHAVMTLCLFILAAGLFLGAGQRTPQDLIRGGKTAPSAGGEFLDAQVVTKSDDRLLQILAIRRTEAGGLPGPSVRRAGQPGGGLGLWHAYQAPNKTWISNGIVFDLSPSVPGGVRADRRFGAKAAIGNLRLAAASDAAGRLHAVVIDSDAGGRSLYLLRDANASWRALEIAALPETLSDVCLVPKPESDGVSLLGLADGTRIAEYVLSTSSRSGVKSAVPGELRGDAFAVSRDDRYFFFLIQSPEGEFRGVERHAVSGQWLLEPQKFMRGFRDPIGNAPLRSLFGFRDQNGLMQVVGIAGGGGVVHIYRDEIGTWYNNGIALQAPGLRRISGGIDDRGLINVVGLTSDGRIWHGFRAENHAWRDNGVLFDARSQ